MSVLFKIFIGLGGLIVLLLCAALIAPYFINWDDFTDKFEQQASELIGQPVKVGGDAQVRLLPLPYLSFSKLEVGRDQNGAALMQVDSFSLKVELFPFLSGDVQIVEMIMDHPHLNLVMGEDGITNWDSASNSIITPDHVQIEKIKIRQGELVVSGLSGERTFNASGINGEMSAQSLLGPWKMDLTADVNDVRSAFQISTGTYQDNGSIRLKVDAKREDRPYRLLLDGPLSSADKEMTWDGKFFLGAFSEEQVNEMTIRHEPLPISLEGKFTAIPEKVKISAYRLEIGDKELPYYVTGSAQMDLLDEVFFWVKADGAQIDLANLNQNDQQGKDTTLQEGLANLLSVLERMPIPAVKGQIDIHLPALVSKDAFIREVKASISPSDTGWEIANLRAELPGSTSFEAEGSLKLKNEPGFIGKMLLASRQPSGFASWVSGEVDPEFRKLRSFGLDSSIDMNPNSLVLAGMELRLDDALIQGSFEHKLPENENPVLHLALNGDHMDGRRLEALFSLILGSREDLFQAHDLDVDLKAKTFVAKMGDRNINLERLDAHVEMHEGAININRLNVDNILGAKLSSSGSMENILLQPSGNSKLTLTASDGTQLARLFQELTGKHAIFERFINQPQLTQGIQLNVELSSKTLDTGAQGQILASGIMGGSELDLHLRFDGLLEDTDFNAIPLTLNVQANSDTPSILLKQIGFNVLPVEVFGEFEGPMKLSVDMQGKLSKQVETRISSSLPGSNLSMVGAVAQLGRADYNSNFEIKLGSENIDAYTRSFGVNIPGILYGEKVPFSLFANLTTAATGLKFEQLGGQISGNAFVGNLAFENEVGVQTQLNGELSFDKINPALFIESVYGAGQDVLASSDDNTFKTPYFEGLDGKISLAAKQLILKEEIIGTDAKFDVDLDDGNLEIKAQDLAVLGGAFTGEMELRNVDGLVLSTATYQLEGVDLSQLVDTTSLPDIWHGRIFINGSLETNGNSVDELTKNLAGAGKFELIQTLVTGFNPDGFRQILMSAEADGFEPGADVVRHLVDKHLLDASMKIPDVTSDFIISRGHLKVNKVVAELADAKVVGELDVDLSGGGIKAQLHSLFDQQKRYAVAGAQPQVSLIWEGTSDVLKPRIDSTRLEGYMALKAIELGQRKIQIQEAKALEKQRLKEQLSALKAKEDFLARQEQERLDRIKFEKEARKRAEAEKAEQAAAFAVQDAYDAIEEEINIETIIDQEGVTIVEPTNDLRDVLKQRQQENISEVGVVGEKLKDVNRLEPELAPR